jgi:hypothetical protein
MNESIQVTDDEAFDVVDWLPGEFRWNPFLPFNKAIFLIAELIQQNLNLLFVVFRVNLLHELFNFLFLIFHTFD